MKWLFNIYILLMISQLPVHSEINIVAHRGNSSVAPENTMAAVKSSIALDPQPQWIEIDLHQSKDGVLVVCHDDTTQRTTGVAGMIRQMSYAELATLDAGYSAQFGETFQGEKLPTLEEVLEAVEGTNINIMIECKQLLLEEPVIELLKARNELDRHIIASFDELTVYRAKALAPEVTTLYLVGEINQTTIGRAKDVRADIIGSNLKTSLESVGIAQEAGFQVWVWTVDEPEAIQSFVQAKVNAIITNKPKLAIGLLQE